VVWYVSIFLYIWELFKHWNNTIIITPFQTLDMLWVLVPVWLGWFFAEFFQEKKGTSMGNAITNSIIIVWGSIDCSRQTVRLISTGVLTNFWSIFARFTIIALILAYGVLIIFFGWKGNPIIKRIGRVREVTYIFAMFVPVFYNVISLSLKHILAAIIFFPLFYFTIELLDKFTPNPKAMIEDIEEGGKVNLQNKNFGGRI